jgi:hypothetical protein
MLWCTFGMQLKFTALSRSFSLSTLPLLCLHNSRAACTQAEEEEIYFGVPLFEKRATARAEYGSKEALMIASQQYAYGAQSFCRGTLL